MEYFILAGYEFAAAMVSFLCACAAFQVFYRKRGMETPKRHFLLLCVFAVYVAAVLHFTGAGTLYNLLMYGARLSGGQVNLVPFSRAIDVTGYALNILLFLPFGFLLPFIWRDKDRPFLVAAFGLMFSLLIELSQLLNNRSTDVDDLIMNTLGTVVGFVLYRIYLRLAGYPRQKGSVLWAEPEVCVAAMFLGRFLLFHEIWLVRILYF